MESETPEWPPGTGQCVASEEALEQGIRFRVMELDDGARELLMERPYVNISENDIARGTLAVWTEGFPATVFLALVARGDEISISVSGVQVAPPRDRAAWDRDVSGPDVVIELECAGSSHLVIIQAGEGDDIMLAPEGVPFDGGFNTYPACSVARRELYRNGLAIHVWDDDTFELMGEGIVRFAELTETTQDFAASGSVQSLTVDLVRQLGGAI